jgi:hypothetical protein
VTTGGVVGGPLQHEQIILIIRLPEQQQGFRPSSSNASKAANFESCSRLIVHHQRWLRVNLHMCFAQVKHFGF